MDFVPEFLELLVDLEIGSLRRVTRRANRDKLSLGFVQLLGGLSRVRNIERRAEVPWLAQIPLVGFFFKTEGYDDENQSLMILIKARITDVRDELKRIEAR